MTAPYNNRRGRYLVTNPAGQAVFPISFPLADEEYLQVFANGDLVDAADYVVSLTALNITFNNLQPQDTIVTLEGARVIERETDYPLRGDLRSKRLNSESDALIQICQELRRDVNRMIQLNKAEESDVSSILPLAEAGRALCWSSDGKSLKNTSFDLGAIDDAIEQTEINAALTAADAVTSSQARNEAQIFRNEAQAAAAGMKRKNPVRAATTGALPSSTYANGANGVGATITATANGAFPAQDTVTLLGGEGLLVKNEAAQLRHGLYTLTNAGSAGTPWVLTRQPDCDTWAETVAAVVTVMEGATQADLDYLCTSNAGGTIGTTAITWQAYNSIVADGAVSTAAKIVNGIISFAKMAAAAIATRLQVEAQTSSVLLTADLIKYHPALPKVWVMFDGTGTPSIKSSYRVSSITDNGVGDYTINFSVTMADAFFTTIGNMGISGGGVGGLQISAQTTTSVRVLARQINNNTVTYVDNTINSVAVYGALAP